MRLTPIPIKAGIEFISVGLTSAVTSVDDVTVNYSIMLAKCLGECNDGVPPPKYKLSSRIVEMYVLDKTISSLREWKY